MHPRDLQRECPEPRARFTIVALLIVALAGCATAPTLRPGGPSTEAPYLGVFTGEFVDGKPLYRFPAIEVVGSRSSVTYDDSSERDRS
jgi:hypothetical protein